MGFDTHGTPMGSLTCTTSLYRYGYEGFKLEDFCDGYIYLEPFIDNEGVTPIDHFINESNLAEAKQQCPDPEFRNATADIFNAAISRNADIPKRLKHLVAE